MVLGHSFNFDNHTDAEQLVRYLKKENVSARIEPEADIRYNIRLKGRCNSLRSYLLDFKTDLEAKLSEEQNPKEEEQVIEKTEVTENVTEDEIYPCQKMTEYDNKDEGNTSVDEVEEDGNDFEREEDEEWIDEELDEIDDLLNILEEKWDTANKVLSEIKPGDILISKDECSDDPAALNYNFLKLLTEYSILIENNLVQFEEDKLIFSETKPVDELFFTLDLSPDLLPEDEKLEKYDLIIVRTIKAVTNYKVKTGPEYMFRIDPDKIEEELYSLDIEEADIMNERISFFLKQEVFDRIMNVLESGGAGTVDKLLKDISEDDESYNEKSRTLTQFKINPDFAINTIEDLKKLELIRIKGNRIKKVR